MPKAAMNDAENKFVAARAQLDDPASLEKTWNGIVTSLAVRSREKVALGSKSLALNATAICPAA